MTVRYAVGESDERPWGRWEVLATGETYACKRITVKPGGKLSLQLHRHREEHWIITEGSAVVTCGDERKQVESGSHVFIPLQAQHRIENAGDVDVVFIEVQRGERLDENDIVRLEDVYGR